MWLNGVCGSWAPIWWVFTVLQMMCTCSRRLCKFQLQILYAAACPFPLSWPWWVSQCDSAWWWLLRGKALVSFSVWLCLVVVAALWVAVDTCTLCSRLAFCLTPPPPPAVINTFPELIPWRWVKLWTRSSFLSTKLLTVNILSYNATFNQ